MFCNKCGTELKDSSSFCFRCGQPVAAQVSAQQPQSPPPQQPLSPPPQQLMPMAYAPVQPGKKLSKGALIGIIAGAVVLAIGITLVIVFAAVGVKNKADTEANRRTCLANLRTIDAALQTYAALTDGKYPDSIEQMAKPGEFQVLKKVPTCPSGTKPYQIAGDDEPYASCPNVATHTY